VAQEDIEQEVVGHGFRLSGDFIDCLGCDGAGIQGPHGPCQRAIRL
jgi:hypothetical protein